MPTYIVKRNVGDALVGCAYLGKMELSERLKTARKNAGLTQQQVADEIGIARVSVTQWEGGISRPDQTRFRGLADLYGVELTWLLEGEGAGPDPQKPKVAGQRKFIRNKSFKFYVKDWRAFMGVKVEDAAETAGMPPDEYGAREEYPINFDLGQIVALADEFGIRPEQFFFPPPKDKPRPATKAAPAKKAVKR